MLQLSNRNLNYRFLIICNNMSDFTVGINKLQGITHQFRTGKTSRNQLASSFQKMYNNGLSFP